MGIAVVVSAIAATSVTPLALAVQVGESEIPRPNTVTAVHGIAKVAAPTTYTAAVEADKPVAFFRLDDAAGVSAVDATGHGHTGAFGSGVTTGVSGATSRDHDAAVATTADPGLTVPAGSMPGANGSRTVEVWVNIPASQASGCGSIPLLDYRGLAWSVHQNGCAGGALDLSYPNVRRVATTNDTLAARLMDGQWHHLAFTYISDTQTFTFYFDGTAQGTTTVNPLADTADPLTTHVVGSIDELAVYPTALTPNRILAHTSAALAATDCAAPATTRYATSVMSDQPSAYYKLDENTGDRIAYDYSGNCLNAARADTTIKTAGALVDDAAPALKSLTDDALQATSTQGPASNGSRTVEVWVNIPASQASGCGSIPLLDYRGLAWSVHQNGCAGGALDLSYPNVRRVATTNDTLAARLMDGQWHHLAFTYISDTQTFTFYFDGTAQGTTTVNPLADTADPLTTHVVGSIDELAVYSTALTPNRILAHTSAALAATDCAAPATTRYATSVMSDQPSAYYKLDENTGDRIAYDYSGNCLNAARADTTIKTAGALVDDAAPALKSLTDDALQATSTQGPASNGSRTVEVWVNIPASQASGCGSIPLLDYRGLAWSVHQNGCAGGALDLSYPNVRRVATTNDTLAARLMDGQWHHLAFTYISDTQTFTFYFDGTAQGTTTVNPLADTADPLTTHVVGSIDELAVYPTALTPNRIAGHTFLGRDQTSPHLIGIVTYTGTGTSGAVVEACDPSAHCYDATTDTQGTFSLPVPIGSYTVTALPPASGAAAVSSPTTASATLSARDFVASVALSLVVPALPSGSSLDSPSLGNQSTGIPTVNWAETTAFHATGCANGSGTLRLVFLGSSQQKFIPMKEDPVGSGRFSATIPPLTPWHGDLKTSYRITCPSSSPSTFLPAGGPGQGGTPVVIHTGPGAALVSVSFGGKVATGLMAIASTVYHVSSPSGSGQVPVSAVFSDGSTEVLGSFKYMSATLSQTTGPSSGGQVITISGSGFGPDSKVIFGTTLAPKVVVNSPTALTVTTPPTFQSQTVVVVSGGGYSNNMPYTAAGPDTSNPAEDAAKWVYDNQDGLTYGLDFLKYATSGDILPYDALADYAIGQYSDALGLNEAEKEAVTVYSTGVGASLFFAEVAAPEAVLATVAVVAAFAIVLAAFNIMIDPSGVVVDADGVPIGGATVTIQRRNPDGSYADVPNGAATISPTTNPETTDGDGGFSWLAVAGTYQLKVDGGSSCLNAQTHQPITTVAGPYVLPPPAVGLVITLTCTIGAPAKPSVTALAPGTLPSTGGVLTISGSNLAGTTRVLINGVVATGLRVLSPFAVTVLAPAGTGRVHIQVQNKAGLSVLTDADLLTYAAGPTALAPGTFTALTPTRVLDTRGGTGGTHGPVAGAASIAVQILGAGGVPATGVSAVVANLTVTAPTSSGYITAYPDGITRPNASNLNFTTGQSIPNLVVIPVGADGKIRLYNGSAGNVHLILDVAGYYLSGTPTQPGAFTALTPTRVLDTRGGTGGTHGPVAGAASIAVQILGAGGVPATGVSAVVANLTVTAPTSSGYITAYPDGITRPNASNLNFTTGQSIPNLVVIPVGADGKIRLYNGSAGNVHLILDVAGYYLSGTPTQPGAFTALTPTRVLDTRGGTGGTHGPVAGAASIAVQILGAGGVPATGVSAVVANLTVTAPTSSGYITAYPDGITRPNASNLNFTTGQSIPNLVVIPVGADGKIRLYNGSAGNVHLILDVAGYYLASKTH